jgi:Mg-chelatase subunit ChlD
MNEEKTQPLRPGRRGPRRSLDFIWICDTSGSMSGRRIASVNRAGQNALEPMRRQAAVTTGARVSVRVLAFDEDVRWITPERTPVESFEWPKLEARSGKLSSVGDALVEVANQLKPGVFEEYSLAPVLVLLSDGYTLTLPGRPSLADGLAAIAKERAGLVSARYAVAIGGENERRTDALERFVGAEHVRRRLLIATGTSALAAIMAHLSSVPIQRVSEPTAPEAPLPTFESGDDDDWIS